jgi:hypothetical protein
LRPTDPIISFESFPGYYEATTLNYLVEDMMKDFPSEEYKASPNIPYVGRLNSLLILSVATNTFCYEEHIYFIVLRMCY